MHIVSLAMTGKSKDIIDNPFRLKTLPHFGLGVLLRLGLGKLLALILDFRHELKPLVVAFNKFGLLLVSIVEARRTRL